MAVVTFLLSYIARQASNIVQAVFGWSITALFGKLQRRQQIMVIAALVLSLAWPLLVIGAFLPNVAAWAIAFLPLHKLLGTTVLRIVWITLAVLAPIGVGLLVRAAAPGGKTKPALAALQGFPMALGFFLGFLVIVVSVPIIKLASIARGWSDEHVYVQPHDGQYDAVLHSLAEACERAGMTAQISDVPAHMQLATTIMRKFASGAVTPFVPAQLKRVTGEGVQMYLYPADLLLRGKSKKVARIRAMFSRTELDAQAYLVESNAAKHVQDALRRLNVALAQHPSPTLATRLREVFREMRETDVSYPDFALLESMARNLERRMITANVVPYGTFPIDEEPDALGTAHQEAVMHVDVKPEALSAPELLRRTVQDAHTLVRNELELAKHDLRSEARAAGHAVIELLVAYSCALLVLASLVTSMATHSKLALVVAAVFLVAGGIAGALGWKARPWYTGAWDASGPSGRHGAPVSEPHAR
jgi:hypothetical protein